MEYFQEREELCLNPCVSALFFLPKMLEVKGFKLEMKETKVKGQLCLVLRAETFKGKTVEKNKFEPKPEAIRRQTHTM